jgi:hypothetical protein
VAELRGEIHRILSRWRSAVGLGSADLHPDEPIIAATRSSARGWIALLADGRLVSSLGDAEPASEPVNEEGADTIEALLRALRHADGAERAPRGAESARALHRLEQWSAHDWAKRSCAIAPLTSPLRRRILRRIESALTTVPRHRRSEAISLASSLRAALEGRLTLGMERALDDLPDDQEGARWLTRAATLLCAPDDVRTPRDHAARRAHGRAIILFAPD